MMDGGMINPTHDAKRQEYRRTDASDNAATSLEQSQQEDDLSWLMPADGLDSE